MLKIGWSRKTVTTNERVNIPGQFYYKPSRGVHDDITITALCMESDGECVFFLSGDFVSLNGVLSDIRTAVKEKNSAIPTEKIIFSATHTHTSPSFSKNEVSEGIPDNGESFSSSLKYRQFFLASVSEAVCESFQNLEEGGIAYGYGNAQIGHNRRCVYDTDFSTISGEKSHSSYWVSGHVKMYGDTNDSRFLGYESGADSVINIMFTFDKTEKLTGALINIPCPAQTSEGEYYLSAGFWNEVREYIRKEYGDIHILPQCSAAGDISPTLLHCSAAQERKLRLKYEHITDNFNDIKLRHYIGEMVKNVFDEVYPWAKKEIFKECIISHKTKNVSLKKRKITKEEYEYCKENYKKFENPPFVNTDVPEYNTFRNSRFITQKNRFLSVIKRYESQKKEVFSTAEIHTVRIGDIAFATNPFELFTDFGHRIQAQSPFTQTFIVQLCAQPEGFASGYLPTELATKNKGYSASFFCNSISFEGGNDLVHETVDELLKIYGNPERNMVINKK